MATLPLEAAVTKDGASSRLAALNRWTPAWARLQFRRCCGSSNWARKMVAGRPFPSIRALMDFADATWSNCSHDDYKEAFAAHPRIGEKGSTQWSQMEQSGARSALLSVRAALARGNRAYEARFGYTFIVFASGKSAKEMLAILEQRLNNDAAQEIQNAAEQQRLITRLRLEKLLTQ
jgi:OHCU decarboxylase